MYKVTGVNRGMRVPDFIRVGSEIKAVGGLRCVNVAYALWRQGLLKNFDIFLFIKEKYMNVNVSTYP